MKSDSSSLVHSKGTEEEEMEEEVEIKERHKLSKYTSGFRFSPLGLENQIQPGFYGSF